MDALQFFEDPDMDFATRCVLSGVRHGMSEVGETLAAIELVDDGDPTSWLRAFVALGRRLRGTADEAAERGHRYSAWNAALRSANYLYAGLWWGPATPVADEVDALWAEHRASWDLAVDHWPTPVRRVAVPHGDADLPGWWFSGADGRPGPSPAVVLVQGLGTPISDVTMTGLDGALARGYHVLVFDGPGQGEVLHRRRRTLDPSMTDAVRAAVAWTARRSEVDADRVALVGVGAGAWFAAAAAAACTTEERSPAALVLDPPIVDLGRDAASSVRDAADERARRLLWWTTTGPTGATDPTAAALELATYRLDATGLGRIGCPTLAVTAEDAFGGRGQCEPALAALRCPHEHVVLRTADGAGADNGIDASQVHDAAVYDWLDATLEDASSGGSDDAGPTRRTR